MSDESPFRVSVIGDWSGRVNRSLFSSSTELADRRPLVIDRDNLNRIMSKLGVKLHLPVASDGSLSLTIGFNQLDDFHPDRLFQRLEIFENLRRSRSSPSNPSTFANKADEFLEQAEDEASTSSGSLLDQILEAKPGEASASPGLSPE